MHDKVDVAIVGAGAAGLYTALVAAEAGSAVLLVSSSPLDQSASYRAQGGLAAALGGGDDPELHLEDTLAAGRGATRASAARILCDEAPERVRELERRSVPFDTDPDGGLALGLEGGHSRRRVVHAGGSATGRRVADALSAAAIEHDRIEVHERSSALRLWLEDGRCVGLVTDSGAVSATATLLATGGAAALWKRTTNPPGALGGGLLLAHDAGATLADLELLQFHPTALVAEGAFNGFLITEAVRGEGARLLTSENRQFVDELAPRDVVARAIHAQIERSGEQFVLLDMRDLKRSFPNIVETLARAGIDPRRDLVPVAPAAHYTIGGVVSDTDGRSTLSGLFTVGECACTGVHGANRLASNSLSECFVFGRRAALAAAAEPARPPPGSDPPTGTALVAASEETKAALWAHAGIVRSADGLGRLEADPHPLARLVARGAAARQESRGCHVRSDFPAVDAGLDRFHFLLAPGSSEPEPQRWD